MTNVKKMTKLEFRARSSSAAGFAFVIGISDFFCHLELVICHSQRSATIVRGEGKGAEASEVSAAAARGPSISTATTVRSRFFCNWRKANLRSFVIRGRFRLASHSVRNACIGSTLAARRAGHQQANDATAMRSSVMPPNVSGSEALV